MSNPLAEALKAAATPDYTYRTETIMDTGRDRLDYAVLTEMGTVVARFCRPSDAEAYAETLSARVANARDHAAEVARVPLTER